MTIITFGRDVKVLQYYSTDYTKISQCVGNATSIKYCMFMIVHYLYIYKHKKPLIHGICCNMIGSLYEDFSWNVLYNFWRGVVGKRLNAICIAIRIPFIFDGRRSKLMKKNRKYNIDYCNTLPPKNIQVKQEIFY